MDVMAKVCVVCGGHAKKFARGACPNCYTKFRRQGRLDELPRRFDPAVTRTEKPCPRCQRTLLLGEFTVAPGRADGRSALCTSCDKEHHREYYASTRSRWLNRSRAKRYGITPDEYTRLFAEQNGVCAICRRPCKRYGDVLPVDHDHGTGRIRGLLCENCNHGLGKFKDDPDLLIAAAAYLLQGTDLLHSEEELS
jgi:hypothetical protein